MFYNPDYALQAQIIKGNADITDPAQEELHRQIAERELRAQFPEFFAAENAAVASSAVAPV